MSSSISVGNKSRFLNLLSRHEHYRTREAKWIIEYLKAHNADRMIFTTDVEQCPNGVLIRMKSSKTGVPFAYYVNGIELRDAEQAFHRIRKASSEESIYIDIRFDATPSFDLADAYMNVLEKHPYEPKTVTAEIQRAARDVIDASLQAFRLASLDQEIDRALDERDERLFYDLCQERMAVTKKNGVN